MSGPALAPLRARLETLKSEAPGTARVWERLRGWVGAASDDFDLEPLRELDRGLDLAGVHTTADVAVLRELARLGGRLSPLAEALRTRAAKQVERFERALSALERAHRGGTARPGALGALGRDFVRLARVVRVAEVLAQPAATAVAYAPLPAPSGVAAAPVSPRLAIAERWLEGARLEVDAVTEKRRQVELAHQLLLRVSAETDAERDRLRRARLDAIAARERLRGVPEVQSLPELVRHLRHVARADPRVAYRSLRALYERATEAGDVALAERASLALAPLLADARRLESALERQHALERAGVGALGSGRLPAGGKAGAADDVLERVAFALPEGREDALALAAGVARYFDLEGELGEAVVAPSTSAARPVQRTVPWPTPTLTIETTQSLANLQNLVIQHPKLLLYELAAGRHPVRAYLEDEAAPVPKSVRRSAVRVYVLDASGSMHGARARFRDAIVIAELNAIRIKASLGLPFDPLYLSFFNDVPTELKRIEDADDAVRHIEALFRRSPAEGQTDISLALMSAFDSIRAARGIDPYLARATVVLVTDGEDHVELDLVRRLRKPVEGVELSLSFISLGEENPDLRVLATEQRADGGHAFYQHLTDAELEAVRTEFDSPWRTLLPRELPLDAPVLEPLLPHLEALEALAAGRPVRSPERRDAEFEAFFPETLPAARGEAEGRAVDLLEAISEAAALVPAERRAGECVSLLLHLLALYEVPKAAWLPQLAAGGARAERALASLRRIARPFGVA